MSAEKSVFGKEVAKQDRLSLGKIEKEADGMDQFFEYKIQKGNRRGTREFLVSAEKSVFGKEVAKQDRLSLGKIEKDYSARRILVMWANALCLFFVLDFFFFM